MNLANQLGPRTGMAVGFAMERSAPAANPASPWYHFTSTTGLVGEQVDDTTIVYKRFKGGTSYANAVVDDGAQVVLRNLQLADGMDVQLGPLVTISSDKVERFEDVIDIDEGTTLDRTISHTFAKLHSFQEQNNVAMTAAIEAVAGWKSGEAGGFEGSVKVSLAVNVAHNKQTTDTETETDMVSVVAHIVGPWRGKYIATRSTDRVSQTITTRPSFEHQVEVWESGRKVFEWNSFDELKSVLMGEAPTNRDLARQFLNNPISGSEFRSIEHYLLPEIRWAVVYDSFNRSDIRLKKDA